MSLADYSALQTAITNFMDDSDLSSYIPDFITLCESTLNRRLRCKEMQKRATATLSTSTRFIACPTRFAEMQSFRLNTTQLHGLKFLTNAQIDDFYQSTSGKPEYYSVWGDEIEFERLPDSAYTAEMKYFQKVSALSNSNTTNDVLTYHPDLYLYGSLIAAEAFGFEDNRMGLWKAFFEQALEEANREAKKSQRGGSELRVRTNGSTP